MRMGMFWPSVHSRSFLPLGIGNLDNQRAIAPLEDNFSIEVLNGSDCITTMKELDESTALSVSVSGSNDKDARNLSITLEYFCHHFLGDISGKHTYKHFVLYNDSDSERDNKVRVNKKSSRVKLRARYSHEPLEIN